MLAGCSGCGGCRHISLPGDVIGKSKTGDVTSVTTGALTGADGSVAICWKKTPCAAAPAGGGACSGTVMAVLLTVTGAIEPEAGGPGGGGAWMPGLGSGVRGPGANIAACGEAAMKTGAPAASDDKMSGRAS